MKNLFLFLFLIAMTINAFGQNENALQFDGVNDRVDLPTKIHDSIPGTGTIERKVAFLLLTKSSRLFAN